MDELRNREYNGWQNRWTWLVHLHLSNEQAVFLEIAQLVATEPDDTLAGRLVEAWVKSAITRWMNRLPGGDRSHDDVICHDTCPLRTLYGSKRQQTFYGTGVRVWSV